METKEIIEALDLGGEVTTLDQLKELHSKKFVSRSRAWEDDEVRKTATGKFAGSITTIAKKAFDLSPDEIKDKKWEEIIEIGASKLKGKIDEIETASKKGKDDSVIDLESKLEKAKKDLLEFKSAAELASKTLQEKEGLFEKEKKGWKANSLFDNIKKEFEKELVSDIDPLKMKGFKSEIEEKYIFELDETGEELAVYGKDGKRVPDPKKLGSFITPKDLLITEATKHKLVKLNTGTKTVINDFKGKDNDGSGANKRSNIDPKDLPEATRKRMEAKGLL